jgi:hypothetical protein
LIEGAQKALANGFRPITLCLHYYEENYSYLSFMNARDDAYRAVSDDLIKGKLDVGLGKMCYSPISLPVADLDRYLSPVPHNIGTSKAEVVAYLTARVRNDVAMALAICDWWEQHVGEVPRP